MSRGLKVLSLFDGISCGMVALERAEIPVERYVAYEIDKYAIQVSKANYPQIEHMGDVTTADFTQYKGFDLLIGGSPCQDLSITQSKTRAGLKGDKSSLFCEFKRAFDDVNPKYFLFENVANMTTECKDIISAAIGVQPIYINSNCFVPQDRGRYYWTNIFADVSSLVECDKTLSDILDAQAEEKYFYSCGFDFKGEDKKIAAQLHINGHDILKRVYSKNFKCGTLTTCGGGNTQKKVYIDGKCRKLTPIEYERLQGLPDNYTSSVAMTNRYNCIGNGWTVDVIVHILKGLREELSRC